MPLGIPVAMIGFRVSGDCAGMTLYTDRFGRNVAFPQAPPRKPPTAGQLAWKAAFAKAMAAWHALDEPRREDYRWLAKHGGIPMLGHNIYLSLCLRYRLDLWETLCRQSFLPLARPVDCRVV